MKETRNTPKKPPKGNTLQTAKLESPTCHEVIVEYLPEANKFTPRETIHARRIIPQAPKGTHTPDLNPSPALALDMQTPILANAAPGRGILAATDDLTLVKKVPIDSVANQNTSSHTNEPSVASNGEVVFYTGNWYAAVSMDGGTTFQYINPYTAFPDPPNIGFCCDQVVHYIRKIDTFVWLLQYTQNAAGENIQRLAFATTANVKLRRWQIFDITPQNLGLPGVFLDFPDLAVGSNMLYATTNGFLGNQWTASVIVRLPLADVKSGNPTAQQAISRDNFSFRVAQHCGTRAYWATHEDTSTLRVFSWNESEAQPTFSDVKVASWESGDYRSITPDGFNWLGRADERLGGATKVGGELWFAWGAGRGGANNRPNPYVQIARIKATTLAVLDNINIWDPNSAICYAALAANSNREVGVSYTIGGGGRFPSHVVGVLTGTRKETVAVEGAQGPADEKWGDYLTIRRHYPNARLFVASGHTLQSSSVGNRATPHFILFGRSSEV